MYHALLFGQTSLILSSIVDYDKIAAQYSRMFYWTTLEFYTPMQVYQRIRDHSYLEGYAGPFHKIDTVEPLPLVS